MDEKNMAIKDIQQSKGTIDDLMIELQDWLNTLPRNLLSSLIILVIICFIGVMYIASKFNGIFKRGNNL